MYKIMITKFVPNESYKEQIEKYEEAERWGRTNYDRGSYPQPTKADRVLEVDLEEHEYKAIKEALFKVWDNPIKTEG